MIHNPFAIKAQEHLRLAEVADPRTDPLFHVQMALAYAMLAPLDIPLGESQPMSGGTP